MRKRIFYFSILVILFSCSPKRYNYSGSDFSLFGKESENLDELITSRDGCYDFKLDAITELIDGVPVPWVRVSDRTSDFADGKEFSEFYSYVSFIDENRVAIYAPYKVNVNNVKNDSIDFKQGSKNFDFLRGYYHYDGKSKLEIEVENKKRKEIMFFTFKVVLDTVRVEGGYVELDGGTYYRTGNQIRSVNGNEILVKGGRINTNRGVLRIIDTLSRLDLGSKLNITPNETFTNSKQTIISIAQNDCRLATGFKLNRSGTELNFKGEITIKDGAFSIDTSKSAGNDIEVSSGVFYLEKGTIRRDKVVALKLESLKVKNKLPLKGSLMDGREDRYIKADSVFEFTPLYLGVKKKLKLFMDLPQVGRVKVDSVKNNRDTIIYHYDGNIWKENKNNIKTW